jgi:hypothetical protein
LQHQESLNKPVEDISEPIEIHEMIEEASKVIKERAAKKREEEKLQLSNTFSTSLDGKPE